jgi:hypothetical protein
MPARQMISSRPRRSFPKARPTCRRTHVGGVRCFGLCKAWTTREKRKRKRNSRNHSLSFSFDVRSPRPRNYYWASFRAPASFLSGRGPLPSFSSSALGAHAASASPPDLPPLGPESISPTKQEHQIPGGRSRRSRERARAASQPSTHHAQGRGQAPLVRPRLAPRRRRRPGVRHPGPRRRRPPRSRRRRRRARPQGALRHRLPLLHRRQRYVPRSPFSPSLRSALPWIDA